MIIPRRQLLRGALALLTAPAIVRASSLMPIKPLLGDGVALTMTSHPINFRVRVTGLGFDGALITEEIEINSPCGRHIISDMKYIESITA